MRILPISTLALAVLAGAFSAHNWFVKFTDKDPAVWQGRVVTSYDLAIDVGQHIAAWGFVGCAIDYLISRSLLKRDERATRSSLLNLRERAGLTEDEKQAIDLALALSLLAGSPTP
jgi:hypothetical protein